MNIFEDLAVAMPTLARTEPEAAALAKSIQTLLASGFRVVAADGGSHSFLLEYLRGAAGVTLIEVPPGSGLVNQVRSALKVAGTWRPGRILYTEPDKRWFFEHRLGEFLNFSEREETPGLVLASRVDLSSFPETQRLTERLANELIGHALGVGGDFLYGPIVLDPRLVSRLDEIPNDLGWGWRIYLMALSHRLGLRLRVWGADLPCPEAQRGENDFSAQIYRMEQMAQNVRGLALGLKARS